MKKTLGIFGTMICSAALLALPAVAQERGNDHNRNTQTYNQSYNAAPVNTQNYRGATQSYGQNARANEYSSYTVDRNDHSYRDRDQHGDRYRHHRRDHDWDRWDWR